MSEQKHKHLVILDKDYKAWHTRLTDVFYGLSLEKFIADAAEIEDEEAENKNSMSDAKRRQAWSLIKESLGTEISRKVRQIPVGQVENLLHKIESIFYTKTRGEINTLKDKLREIQLSDYKNVDEYILAAREIKTDLHNNGEPYANSDYIYNLLRGLPGDAYGLVKSDVVWRQDNQEDEVTPEQVERQILGRAQDPTVPGTMNPKSANVAFSNREVCKAFSQKGKCRFGERCRYIHIPKPSHEGNGESQRKFKGKCSYCEKKGHKQLDCRKKKRDQENKSQDVAQNVQDMVFLVDTVLSNAPKTSCNPAHLLFDQLDAVENRFLLDGGSSCHVIRDESNCYNVRPAQIQLKVGGGILQCEKIGDADIQVPSDDHGSYSVVTLKDIRIVPTMGIDIISENKFAQK